MFIKKKTFVVLPFWIFAMLVVVAIGCMEMDTTTTEPVHTITITP